MSRELKTPHGALPLPVFLPDATRAVVKSVDSSDLENCGVTGLVVNTFHLLARPGVRILAASGIHGFMGWNRPIVSDSGGWPIDEDRRLVESVDRGNRCEAHCGLVPDIVVRRS